MKVNDAGSSDLSTILEAYLSELEEGRAPNREELIARYPEIASELGPCITALEFLRQPEVGMPGPFAPDRSRRIGDFEIGREVGRGGMGVVYEARQISLDRRVALKMLPFGGVLDPRQLQRFKNEAMAAASLHHGNIVPVYSVGSERGIHYYAMQYIDGVSVAELIAGFRDAEAGPAGSSEAARALTSGRSTRSAEYCRNIARLGADVARALDYAHEQGVVHRDVKPANLLVDGSGRAWVTDFGLAAFRTDQGLTMTGDLVGTIRYMSPEQTRARRAPLDHRTDVYSLGATLFELLTLTRAFPGEDPHRVLAAVSEREPPAPRRLNPAVPVELETIVQKAMEKRAEVRYQTAQEFADDLVRFLEDRPIRARRPSPLSLAAKWARRHRPLVWAAAAVFLLAFTGLAAGSALMAREARRFESLYGRATDTLDRVLDGVSDSLGTDPRLAGLQKELLTDIRDFHHLILLEEEAAEPREVAQAHSRVGRIQTILGADVEAEDHLLAANRILDDLARSVTDDPAPLADRIAVQQHLGELWLTRDGPERAREWLESAVRAAEDLERAFPSTASRLARIRGLLALGRYHDARREPEEALVRCYRPAREDVDALHEIEPENVEVRKCRAAVYQRAGDALLEAGDIPGGLGAWWRAGSTWEGLELELPEDPEADSWRHKMWQAEAVRRAATWAKFRELPPREPAPDDLAGIDATLQELCPVTPAERPLTSLPDRFVAGAIAYLPYGDGPFVGFRLRGDASHGGRWSGTSRCIQVYTVKGLATVSITELAFGDDTSIEAWGLGLPDDNTRALTGTCVFRNGRGRLAGAMGIGTLEAESLPGMTSANMRTWAGPCVRLAFTGTIYRQE